MAFAVIKFIQNNGTYFNYYMVSQSILPNLSQKNIPYNNCFELIKWNQSSIEFGFVAIFHYCSIMEEQTSAGLLGVHLFPPVMIMMLQSMNTVRFQEPFLPSYTKFHAGS
jgi:hypothetical protein